jgi:hypothetical protein
VTLSDYVTPGLRDERSESNRGSDGVAPRTSPRKAMLVLPRSSEGQRAEGDVTRMALDDAALDFVVAGAPVEVPLFWPCVAFLGVALRGCESGRVGAGA